jgi:hypothetical protein
MSHPRVSRAIYRAAGVSCAAFLLTPARRASANNAPLDPAPAAATAAETAAAQEPKIKPFALLPRVGLVTTGAGSERTICDGGACTGYTGTTYDITYKPALALGADLLVQMGPVFRLGLGVLYSFSNEMRIKRTETQEDLETKAGSLLSTDVIFEFTPKIGRGVWLVPRFQIGLSRLSPAGLLQHRLTEYRQLCLSSALNTECSSADGTHSGLNVGVGVGALLAATEAVRIRIDSLYEYYIVSLYSFPVTGLNASVGENISGTRLLALVGAEF